MNALAAPEPLLSLAGVHKRFGLRPALEDVSLHLAAGEVLGLLGPNGAGKTTLLRLAVDLLRPDAGTVRHLGRPPGPASLAAVGYLPEERGLSPRPRALELLEYLGTLKGLTGRDAHTQALALLDRVALSARARSRVGELSKGNQQKVQLAAALMGRPTLLLVDEPFTGLDPVNRQLALELFQERVRAGAGLLLSTHQLGQVDALCDRIVLLHRGRILLEGPVADVRARFSDRSLRVRGSEGLRALPCVERAADDEDGALRVWLRPGLSPRDLLRESLAADLVLTAFEEHAPTLEQIFVQQVSDTEALAPTPEAARV